MKNLKYLFVAGLLLCLLAPAGVVQAKDRFFHLGYGVLDVIDGDTDTVIGQIPLKGWTRAYTVLPGGKRMVVSASRRYLHVVDGENLKLEKTIDLNKNREGWDRFEFGITSAGDGKTIYAHLQGRRAQDGEAVIATPVLAQIDLDSGEILRTLEVPRGIFQLLLVKGGKEVYAIGQDLFKIDVSGKEMKIAETHSMYDRGMNIFPLWHYTHENDGYFVSPYYTAEGCGLLQINTHTGEISESMVEGGVPFVYSFIYSPDRSTLYGGMDDVYKLDGKSRTITGQTVITEGTSFGMSISTDGKKVYTGGGGSTVSVFDGETLKLLKVINMETDGMTLVRLRL